MSPTPLQRPTEGDYRARFVRAVVVLSSIVLGGLMLALVFVR